MVDCVERAEHDVIRPVHIYIFQFLTHEMRLFARLFKAFSCVFKHIFGSVHSRAVIAEICQFFHQNARAATAIEDKPLFSERKTAKDRIQVFFVIEVVVEFVVDLAYIIVLHKLFSSFGRPSVSSCKRVSSSLRSFVSFFFVRRLTVAFASSALRSLLSALVV